VSIRVANALVLVALVAATACRIERTPRVEADSPATVARAEIELTLRNYQEALLAGDARSAASVFTPGAHVYLPDTPVIAGRGAIDRIFADGFAGESIIDMDMQLESLDLGTRVANQFGTMRQRFRDPDGAEHAIEGRFAIRWVRAADSAWRIDRLIVNHAPADSAAVGES
jgi:ketosteroid isomerase-like protein